MEKKSNNQGSRKDSYTKVFLKSAGVEADQKTLNDFKSVWWFSTRDKLVGGLRITDAGLEFVETNSKIKTYEIELPEDIIITPQIIIWLDQFIDTPWYLQKRFIKVLSEKTAFELYLFSGDIRKFGLARSMSKRRATFALEENITQ